MSASIWRGKQATVRMEGKRTLTGIATSGARRALKMVMRMEQRVKTMKMTSLTKQTVLRRGKILMMGIKI